MHERFKNFTTSEMKILGVLMAVFVLSPMLKSGVVEAVGMRGANG